MSIYTDCVMAAYEILEDPEHNTAREHPGLFTELDVIVLAAQMNGGYSEEEYKQAMTEANVALLKMFRRFEVARYGPVRPPGATDPDYVRLATKIVYAHPALGPKVVETPNGTYKRLMVWQDKNIRQGRRRASNRDDFEPWDRQDFTPATMPSRRRVTA